MASPPKLQKPLTSQFVIHEMVADLKPLASLRNAPRWDGTDYGGLTRNSVPRPHELPVHIDLLEVLVKHCPTGILTITIIINVIIIIIIIIIYYVRLPITLSSTQRHPDIALGVRHPWRDPAHRLLAGG